MNVEKLNARLYKISQRFPGYKPDQLSPPLEDFSNVPECLVPYLKISKTLVFGGYTHEYTGEVILTKSGKSKITGIIVGYGGCTYWDTLVLSVTNNSHVKVGEVWTLADVDWIRCAKSFQEYAQQFLD